MRTLGIFLLVFLMISCSDSDDKMNVQYQSESDFELDQVGTCISQDQNSAFSRFFLKSNTEGAKSYQTYNGMIVDLRERPSRVDLVVRWNRKLNDNMEAHLEFCMKRAFE